MAISDLIQQGGRAGRVAPGKHVVMASEEQIQRQFRGPSTPELLADIAPLVSVCKKVGVEIEDFPTLNTPSKVVIQATMQRMRILDMLDNAGRLTTMGSSKQGSMVSWKGIKVAAVLSREVSCALCKPWIATTTRTGTS